MTAPRFKIVKHTIAPVVPAFLIVATRVRAEQHAARLQSGVQFQQHARQFLPRDMKQRGVGEHTIEMFLRQCELKKVLPPYFAPAMGTRHGDEMLGAFQTDRVMALFDERFEVAPRPAAKVEYCKRRFALDVLQQRLDVLANVVIARAFPELFGTQVVMLQREEGDFFQILWIQFHRRPYHSKCEAAWPRIRSPSCVNKPAPAPIGASQSPCNNAAVP